MKKLSIFTVILASAIFFIPGCGIKREPGLIYMPDMAYSRAYEAYAERDSTYFTSDMFNKGGKQIFYSAIPVKGAVKRGELFDDTLANDSVGYKLSAGVINPISDSTAAINMAESGRLFNINCAICHGAKGAGNGPLSTGGKIGGVANLTLPNYVAMADGTMYHSIKFGKGLMGSYASQLSREQRWMIIKYIRTLQKGEAPATDSTTTAAAVPAVVAVAGAK